jgi:replicative DNA helicase
MSDLIRYEGSDKVMHFVDYLKERELSGLNNRCFKSGFKSFDEKLGGIESGEVVVISGRTKNGKTLFAESWINNILETDEHAAAMILSFEVQAQKLFQKYSNRPDKMLFLPRELKTMDYQWLKDRCLEAKLKFGCQIVLIDHLHFMVDMNTKQNMSLNIGAFMRVLKKEVANELDMAVILIAHQSQMDKKESAGIDSIRDSSFVGQEADSIIIVSRRKDLTSDELEEVDPEKVLSLPLRNVEDNYSQGLALVTIERTRRTGTYEYKKLFIKRGEFLEEF